MITPAAKYAANVLLLVAPVALAGCCAWSTRRAASVRGDASTASMVARPVVADSGALEATHSDETPAPVSGTATTKLPVSVATAKARVGRPAGPVGAARLASPETPAPPSDRITSVGAATTAPADPDDGSDASPPTSADGARGAVAPAAAVATVIPIIRFDLLSNAAARQRFGTDLAAEGLLAGRLGIVNPTARTYLVSVPLVTLRRVGGASVAPVPRAETSTGLAESPLGLDTETNDEASRELVGDHLLAPGASLTGILLYPAADYASVEVLLIDQQSARSERFEGAIPPAPLE
jgi:hypothetical protein